MWKKVLPLLIVLSVAINVAFVGVWIARAVGTRWGQGISRRHVNDSSEIWCPLHRDLGISQEQWKKIEPRLAEFRKTSRSICQEVSRKRVEMIELLAASQVDPQAIAAKQEAIRGGQCKMQQLVIQRLLAEKQVLTPDQQKKFFALLRQRSGCSGHGLMRKMNFGGGPNCNTNRPVGSGKR